MGDTTKKVKRYDQCDPCGNCGQPACDMVENAADGMWVYVGDYNKTVARADKLRRQRGEEHARAEKLETDLAWMKSSRSDVIYELFETKASLFYRETGLLAPGKDWPAAGGPRPKETNHRWDEWNSARGFGDGKGCTRPGCEFCAAEEDEDG